MKEEVISYEYLDDETVSLHIKYSKIPKFKKNSKHEVIVEHIVEYIKASVRGLKSSTVSLTNNENNETEIDILMTLGKQQNVMSKNEKINLSIINAIAPYLSVKIGGDLNKRGVE